MSFNAFPTDDESIDLGWGTMAPPAGVDLVSQAIRKEKLIKEIKAAQEGLKAIYDKVLTVEGEVKKLEDENNMLQVYIDNLTKQLTKRR